MNNYGDGWSYYKNNLWCNEMTEYKTFSSMNDAFSTKQNYKDYEHCWFIVEEKELAQ
jgi:hypothetical protein